MVWVVGDEAGVAVEVGGSVCVCTQLHLGRRCGVREKSTDCEDERGTKMGNYTHTRRDYSLQSESLNLFAAG